MLSGNVPGFTTTLAGTGARGFANGVGTSAQFDDPHGVAIDPTGTFALVADKNNHCIRKIMLSGAGARGFANGVGTSAQFDLPYGVAIDPTGTFALVAETSNHCIRKIMLSGNVPGYTTTLAGTGTA